MNASAVFLMIITILLVWGGLVASIILLQVLPVPSDEETRALQEQIDAEARAADL